jgi:hypothetical protein
MALFVNKKDLKEEHKKITEEQIDKKAKICNWIYMKYPQKLDIILIKVLKIL